MPDIGNHSAIADIGTGTGAWLNDLARSVDVPGAKEVRLVIFDISPAKFGDLNEREEWGSSCMILRPLSRRGIVAALM